MKTVKKYPVQWLGQGVELPELEYDKIERWLSLVAEGHGRVVGPLTYIFTDDAGILEVNVRYLSHDYYTDIITFDETVGRRVSGTMYISLETVRTNSVEVSHDSYEAELQRVIVHGLLHLCGIDDKAPGAREVMEGHEDEALSLLRTL